jgi:hypothetical protein
MTSGYVPFITRVGRIDKYIYSALHLKNERKQPEIIFQEINDILTDKNFIKSSYCENLPDRFCENLTNRLYNSLAECYFLGFGTKMDRVKAIEYCQKAIIKGYDINFGIHIHDEILTSFSIIRIIKYLKQDDSKPDIQLLIARYLINLNKHEEGKQYLKLAADKDPEAMCFLSDRYLRGSNMNKDIKLAVEYAKKAIKNNYVRGYFHLAKIFYDDKTNRFIKYIQKGADLGDILCQQVIAESYFNGIYLRQDYLMAYDLSIKILKRSLKEFNIIFTENYILLLEFYSNKRFNSFKLDRILFNSIEADYHSKLNIKMDNI